MTNPVFLTGATGFLGRCLVGAFRRAGRPVHALVRREADRVALGREGIATHLGDLVDGPSVLAALEAAAMAHPDRALDLVHSGAVISYRSDDTELQRRVNVEGTWNVLDAAYKVGLRRIVHVGSVVAVGCRSGPDLVREDQRWNAAALAVDYATTKRAAEDLALLAAREQDVTIVDPGAIFGPGPERSNTVFLLREIARGRRLWLSPPGGMAVLGVEDCAEGVRLALERGRRGERYLLVESNVGGRELLARIAHLCGAPAPGPRAPRALWWALTQGARRIEARDPEGRVSPQALRMAGADWRADGSKARSELGWQPRPFDEVLRSTLQGLGLPVRE